MSDIQVKSIPVGALGVNCIIIIKDGKAIICDPGGDCDDIISALGSATPAAILLTHSHFDHAGAINELLKLYPECEYLCHEDCNIRAQDPMTNLSQMITGMACEVVPATRTLTDNEEFELIGINIKTFHVPGHSPGQLCFYIEEENMLVCGDTVFAGSIGRSDLPEGDGQLLVTKISTMLRSLPPQTKLFPGHGPCSIAADELSINPYLR